MNRMISRMSVAAKIIGAMSVVVALFLIAIGVVIQTSTTGLHQALIDDTQAQLTEMARQIAMTLAASIDPAALTSAHKMQAIIDRNIAARQTTTSDNLLREIRIHAPDPSSSVGYRAIAADTPENIGQESNPEDIQAIKNDILVVELISENGVPILAVIVPLRIDGKSVATAGIQISMAKGFAQADQQTAKTVQSFMTTAIMVVVMAGLLGFLIMLLVSNSLAKTIKQLVKMAEQIAQNDLPAIANASAAIAAGDLTASVRVQTESIVHDSGDELGDLARAFNSMITRLQGVGTNFTQVTENANSLSAVCHAAAA